MERGETESKLILLSLGMKEEKNGKKLYFYLMLGPLSPRPYAT